MYGRPDPAVLDADRAFTDAAAVEAAQARFKDDERRCARAALEAGGAGRDIDPVFADGSRPVYALTDFVAWMLTECDTPATAVFDVTLGQRAEWVERWASERADLLAAAKPRDYWQDAA